MFYPLNFSTVFTKKVESIQGENERRSQTKEYEIGPSRFRKIPKGTSKGPNQKINDYK